MRVQQARLDAHRAFAVRDPHLTVLNAELQPHRALRQRRQRSAGLTVDFQHVQIAMTGELVAAVLPPHVHRATVSQHHHFAGTRAGLAHPAVVRLADVDPALDGAGQVLLPQVGLVVGAQAFAEAERLIGSGSRFAQVSTEVSTLLTQAKRGM